MRRERKGRLACLALALVVGAASRAGDLEMVDLIDPMTGAVASTPSDNNIHGLGKTFPGAATPFGLVQLSPDTVTGGDNGAGYSYLHDAIEGFSFTHMSGVGWFGDLGNFQVMPGAAGPVRFSHEDEHAEAGYYRVKLASGVTAELTAAPRAGMIRLTYPASRASAFTIDLSRRIGELWRVKRFSRQKFRLTGPHSFEGSILCDHRDGGWGHGAGMVDYALRFRGTCSKPLEGCALSGGESNLVVGVTFPTAEGEQVVLHVAFSFVDEPPAPRGFDFDAMRHAAKDAWREALSLVAVRGGTEEERRVFATALYHAFVDPRAIGDGPGYVRRTVFSGWDVFRSEMPLLALLRPDVVRDTILSMADVMARGDRDTLPVWDLFGCKSSCMVGNPLIPVVATAVEAGITNFDARLVYRLAKETSARRGNAACGYVPGSLSETLEYCYDDWCMASLARRYGTIEDVARFSARAMWYTNCWDASVGWMRARTADGGWVPWKGRAAHGQGCVESNPYQQGWFVPHDVEGLVRLMGGRGRFTSELERFFAGAPANFGWNDFYNHPNEPCHFIPFLFAFSEKPHLVQEWTRRILDGAYGLGVYGLCGNEDCGQMSAWYVLSAIGLHPVCPGDGRWHFAAPVFAEARIRLDPAFYGGGAFVIRAPKASAVNRYVAKATLNGRPLERRWLWTHEITRGGELLLEMTPEPGQ
ncbi:MAG: GH92 family glycosyl hydrolase [Kiritimatiellae bacterium]|nr:GH92 family glycosyl hydrolase [Kiritimatiellia bacterium]